VGHKLQMAVFENIAPRVIGVVGDMHLVDARTAARPLALLSADRFPDTDRDLLVRTANNPATIAGPLRALVAELLPGTPLYHIAPLREAVDRTFAADRFTTVLLAAFAAVALVLAGIGIFGVFSTDTQRRRREIGLRLALGGSAANVILLLLGRAVRRVAMGLLVGLVLAGALGQAMRSLLFGVSAIDPVSMAAVATGVAILTLVATLIPAARALRASPLSVLREE
jgi:putative ABC transport system permease protein